MFAEACVMDDVLSGDRVTFSLDECQVEAGEAEYRETCESVFFTGCSLINYAPELARRAYRTLKKKGVVDGITLQCCGRILEFAPGMEDELHAFEGRLMSAFVDAGVKRIVAACPNCCSYLEAEIEKADLDIQVISLPQALAEAGCAIGMPLFAEEPVAVHDSCPDRETGRYAKGVRALLPQGGFVEMEHNRSHSHCCGSKALAAQKFSAASMMATQRADEAEIAGAKGIVTSCMSCASVLSHNTRMPVYHYLELLYGFRIPWDAVPQLLCVQFMLNPGAPQTGVYYISRKGE